MKHKKFLSKNFYIILGSTLLIIGILASFMVWGSQNLPKIFEYVPSNLDQVMINWPAKNINAATTAVVEIPEAVKAQFQQIEVMIIGQKSDLGSGQQLLFLQTKNDFSPEEFLTTVNPETEILYTYLRLDNGQYLFAPKSEIQSYTKPDEQNSFFGQEKLKTYKSFLKDNSLVMISHNNEFISAQQQYAELFQNVGYFIMGVSSSQKEMKFTSYLLFAKPETYTVPVFKPKFTSYLKSSTIAYIELGDLFTALGINPSELFGTNSGSVQGLVKDKFIANILAKHVGIIISKGSNVTNIGLTLVSKDAELYDMLQPMMPTIGQWIQSLPMLSGASLVSVSQPGKVGYDVSLEGMQKIGFYLEQDGEETKLSIGNPVLDGSSSKNLLYQKSSLATVKVDLDQVIGIYKQLSDIGILGSSITSQESFLSQLEGKTLYGEIALESDRAILEGQIK